MGFASHLEPFRACASVSVRVRLCVECVLRDAVCACARVVPQFPQQMYVHFGVRVILKTPWFWQFSGEKRWRWWWSSLYVQAFVSVDGRCAPRSAQSIVRSSYVRRSRVFRVGDETQVAGFAHVCARLGETHLRFWLESCER